MFVQDASRKVFEKEVSEEKRKEKPEEKLPRSGGIIVVAATPESTWICLESP